MFAFPLVLLPQIFNYRSNIIGHTTRTLRRQNFFVRLLLDHRRSLLMVCFRFNRATRLCSRPTDSTRRQQLRPTDGKKTDNKRSCFATERRRRRRERKEKLVLRFCKLAAGCMMIGDRIEPSIAARSLYQIDLAQLSRFSSDRGKLFGFRQLPANTITSPQSFRPLQSFVTCWFMQTHREHFFLPRASLNTNSSRLSRKQRKLFVGFAIILRESLARTRSDQGQVHPKKWLQSFPTRRVL